jgi:hypothetical protein
MSKLPHAIIISCILALGHGIMLTVQAVKAVASPEWKTVYGAALDQIDRFGLETITGILVFILIPWLFRLVIWLLTQAIWLLTQAIVLLQTGARLWKRAMQGIDNLFYRARDRLALALLDWATWLAPKNDPPSGWPIQPRVRPRIDAAPRHTSRPGRGSGHRQTKGRRP